MLYRSVLFRYVLLSALAIVMSSVLGCGEEEAEKPKAPDVTADGWQSYEAKDYSGSKEKFDEAISIDSNYVDAYVGLGWAYGRMSQLAECISNFQIALSKDPQNADALAGIALAYLADDKYDQAIANATQVLAINPNYSFIHGNVTSRNLHVVLAESYYYKGDFAGAQNEVDILNPGNGLDPSSKDYAAKLLEEIEKISGS